MKAIQKLSSKYLITIKCLFAGKAKICKIKIYEELLVKSILQIPYSSLSLSLSLSLSYMLYSIGSNQVHSAKVMPPTPLTQSPLKHHGKLWDNLTI